MRLESALLIFAFNNPHTLMYETVDYINYSESHVRKKIGHFNEYLKSFKSKNSYDSS